MMSNSVWKLLEFYNTRNTGTHFVAFGNSGGHFCCCCCFFCLLDRHPHPPVLTSASVSTQCTSVTDLSKLRRFNILEKKVATEKQKLNFWKKKKTNFGSKWRKWSQNVPISSLNYECLLHGVSESRVCELLESLLKTLFIRTFFFRQNFFNCLQNGGEAWFPFRHEDRCDSVKRRKLQFSFRCHDTRWNSHWLWF